jgi:hypothetical protein
MSHVKAYRCDCCGSIKLVDEFVGVSPVEDMFEKLNSFPTISTPAAMDKGSIHHCLDCYSKYVLVPSENAVNRKFNENGYKLKLKELHYDLRRKCVENVQLGIFKNKSD